MLSLFSRSLTRRVAHDTPKALSAYFSESSAAVGETEKWPPYNVCSLPFNIKPNPDHIKLKEPHKRSFLKEALRISANALIKQLSMEAATSAREKMDFDSFRPGDAIEVTVDM